MSNFHHHHPKLPQLSLVSRRTPSLWTCINTHTGGVQRHADAFPPRYSYNNDDNALMLTDSTLRCFLSSTHSRSSFMKCVCLCVFVYLRVMGRWCIPITKKGVWCIILVMPHARCFLFGNWSLLHPLPSTASLWWVLGGGGTFLYNAAVWWHDKQVQVFLRA